MSITLNQKRLTVGMVLLAGLIGTAASIQHYSQNIKQISVLQSGIQTCFTRVGQTYTAVTIGDKQSGYLEDGFKSLTEECLAEGIATAEETKIDSLKIVGKKLNNLASNVHWFHEEVSVKNASDSSTQGQDSGSRFEKIENLKDEIVDATEKTRSEMSDKMSDFRLAFFGLSGLVVILFSIDYLLRRRTNHFNLEREKEAELELRDNGGVHSVKAQDIIRLALEQNELNNCARLFVNYHSNLAFQKMVNHREGQLHVANSSIAPVGAEQIEDLWNNDAVTLPAEGSMNNTVSTETKSQAQTVATNNTGNSLENAVVTTLNIASDRFFTQGIRVEMNIQEDSQIIAKTEELEQVIYYSLMNAAGMAMKADDIPYIRISSEQMMGSVALVIETNGEAYPNEFLNSKKYDKKTPAPNIGMEICEEFIAQFQGKIVYSNTSTRSGAITKLVFKLHTDSKEVIQGKLRMLKKGKKKDLINDLK